MDERVQDVLRAMQLALARGRQEAPSQASAQEADVTLPAMRRMGISPNLAAWPSAAAAPAVSPTGIGGGSHSLPLVLGRGASGDMSAVAGLGAGTVLTAGGGSALASHAVHNGRGAVSSESGGVALGRQQFHEGLFSARSAQQQIQPGRWSEDGYGPRSQTHMEYYPQQQQVLVPQEPQMAVYQPQMPQPQMHQPQYHPHRQSQQHPHQPQYQGNGSFSRGGSAGLEPYLDLSQHPQQLIGLAGAQSGLLVAEGEDMMGSRLAGELLQRQQQQAATQGWDDRLTAGTHLVMGEQYHHHDRHDRHDRQQSQHWKELQGQQQQQVEQAELQQEWQEQLQLQQQWQQQQQQVEQQQLQQQEWQMLQLQLQQQIQHQQELQRQQQQRQQRQHTQSMVPETGLASGAAAGAGAERYGGAVVVDLTDENERHDGQDDSGNHVGVGGSDGGGGGEVGYKRPLPASFISGRGGGAHGGGPKRPAMASAPSANTTAAATDTVAADDYSDPNQPSLQEQQLALHLDVLKQRLRDGTLPERLASVGGSGPGSGGSSGERLRPMTGEERLKFEAAADRLQQQLNVLRQDRAKRLALLQQQRLQRRREAEAALRAGGVAGGLGKSGDGDGDGGERNLGVVRAITTGRPPELGIPTLRTSPKGIMKGFAIGGSGRGGSGGGSGSGANGVGGGAKAVSAEMTSGKDCGGGGRSRATEHQQALQAVIANLQVTGSAELEPPEKTLQVSVLKHQRMALAWMIQREKGPEPRGGILADDQGLGKTVTTISLIVTHTNPEDFVLQPATRHPHPHQQQQAVGATGAAGSSGGGGSGGSGSGRGVVEVMELCDDEEEDGVEREEGEGTEERVKREEDWEGEEEGEEDLDAAGIKLGALRAERTAAGAADAADAAAAAADMVALEASGAAAGGANRMDELPLPLLRVEVMGRTTPAPNGRTITTTIAAAPAGPTRTAFSPAVIDLVDDEDEGDEDDVVLSENARCARTTITPTATARGGSSSVSLSQLASANLTAAASTPATAAATVLYSGGQPTHLDQNGLNLAAKATAGGGGANGGMSVMYGPEPANLLPGGTLVVCPTSVLHQWAREIRSKVSPAAGLVVHVYHGKERASTVMQLAAMGVVLTTYGTLAQEAPCRDKQAVRLGRQGTSMAPINLAEDDSGGEEPLQAAAGSSGGGAGGGRGSQGRARGGKGGSAEGGLLYQIKWKRVVLDEAQSIKNPRTLAAHAAWRLFAHCRWCLSGTPIQNTVDDLYSYFRFLRYAPYCESRKFKELIKGKINEKPEIGYKFLQAVLQAVLLRRTKQSTINGEPIIRLPGREQQLVRVKFSPAEATFYKQVQAESLRSLHEAGGAGGIQYVNMLHSLLKLRQACNHPWLVRGGRSWHKTAAPTASELSAARKLSPASRSTLLAVLSGGDAQCPCCADIPEDPVAAVCGHVFCAQCLASQREGATVEGELLCPACSKLLRPADLHSAAALAAAAHPDSAPGAGGAAAAVTASGGAGGGPAEWVTSAKVERLLSLLEGLRASSAAAARLSGGGGGAAGGAAAVKSKSDKRMAGALRKLPPLPSGSAGGGGGSGGKPDKVIVFSQWTSMLDLLEIPLKKAKIQFRRLDGTMTVAHREGAIQDFESRPEVMVLLVSLKAAALGVNLTVANHVVLMDLWWNPTTEEQAIDRAHRIGQTRTVHVTRITIADSVEDRILQLQQAKREVVAAALSEGRDGGGGGGSRLTMDDLRFLFAGLAQQ